MAFQWIQTNIHSFGGDAMAVTLLGHGSSGAACAILHLTMQRRRRNYFTKVILMSGSILSPWSFQAPGRGREGPSVSRKIIKQLTCDSNNADLTLACLQQKSVSDLLRTYENVYQVTNIYRNY